MLRRLVFVLMLLTLVGFALAQTVVPTEGPGDDDEMAAFGESGDTIVASVTQTVNMRIPAVVALHLDVTDLEFDISQVGDYDGTWICVHGPGYRKTDIPNFDALGSTLPLGTYYVEGPNGWPEIKIVGSGGAPIVVDQYPPIDIANGELVEGSKNYFVCYRTFYMQKFSTIKNWQLTVTRDGGTYDMYIQDNTCADFPTATGLFKIDPDGSSVNLLPSTMTSDTTGNLAAGAELCQQGKSWLDDLVVVAVKVNGEEAGPNLSTLTYSITATVP